MLYILSGLTILTAVVLAAASALAGKAVDLPLVGDDAEHLMLVGFGGVALLALLAAVDIVLGVYVWKGRRWAKRGVLLTGGLVVVALFAAGAAPVAVLGLAVTALFDLLLLGPGPARTFFRGQGA